TGGTDGAFRTILFTDMEGSTSHTQRLGDEAAMEIVRRHNAIVRERLARSGGREVKHTGDGIMASFVSATRALECAAAIQHAFAAHNEEHEIPIRVRIGISAGEPVEESGDLFGVAVQLAKRVCDHAEPGQILVANVVRELCMGKPVSFIDRGEVALKGFEQALRLHEVDWRGVSVR
ncbi:MAG TPA: adenylate/guanylate cyclase domain-containing protein, partial [Dehalococcoidia bacterium]|nr:adenylate/guanylate cyclase domain-containing protein [Dehalococcoidia bacterium]